MSVHKLSSYGRRLFLGLGLGALTACGPKEAESPEIALPRSASPLRYSFGTPDGGILGSGAHRGRVTILLFGTTYDITTQAEARRLDQFMREHRPRLNALLVMLEPPQNIEVVRAYQEILNLGYPIAMADHDTLTRRGAFANIQVVPGWVFLDRHGVPRASAEGPLDFDRLRKLTSLAEEPQ
ncbi:MAG: hypothetical protein B6A08_17025 [Sorangiineae bacterium NIC37A_2]|jgi:hypothetical protein|nr:MAG: hypothetical protein B6A08_17025 [Sorangiineae bacterium NIC37A_2]